MKSAIPFLTSLCVAVVVTYFFVPFGLIGTAIVAGTLNHTADVFVVFLALCMLVSVSGATMAMVVTHTCSPLRRSFLSAILIGCCVALVLVLWMWLYEWDNVFLAYRQVSRVSVQVHWYSSSKSPHLARRKRATGDLPNRRQADRGMKSESSS
jgi:hypothetical protein